MKSLQLQSCLTLISANNLSLRDVLDIINNPTNHLEYSLSQLCDDPGIWKVLIDKQYGPRLLLTRMDVDPQNYYAFARYLINQAATPYQIVVDENPEVVDAVQLAVGAPLLAEGYAALPFYVLGSRPVVGSRGYLSRFYFDDPIYIPVSDPQVFIAGPHASAEDIMELFERLKIHLALNFLAKCNQYLADKVEPGGGGFLVEGVYYDHMPSVEDIVNILHSQLVNPGFNALSIIDPDEPTLLFGELIIGVRAAVDVNVPYLTMLIDVAQVKF